jgi:hypothetical protein
MALPVPGVLTTVVICSDFGCISAVFAMFFSLIVKTPLRKMHIHVAQGQTSFL